MSAAPTHYQTKANTHLPGCHRPPITAHYNSNLKFFEFLLSKPKSPLQSTIPQYITTTTLNSLNFFLTPKSLLQFSTPKPITTTTAHICILIDPFSQPIPSHTISPSQHHGPSQQHNREPVTDSQPY